MLQQSTYSDSRNLMRPGDVVAFEGSGPFPDLVKMVTGSKISHVGVVLQSYIFSQYRAAGIDERGGHITLTGVNGAISVNHIIETAWMGGHPQVTINRLSDRIDQEERAVWWLPLSGEVRERMDFEAFYDFLVKQKGVPYDVPQAIKSAVDVFDKWPVLRVLTRNTEDFGKWFCSELVAAGLEKAGAIKSLNCSEVTPINLCRFKLYMPDYVQLKGEPTEIKGYNMRDPEGWGE